MARRCSLTGKGVMTGNNVSHAHNRTRRRFLPNLQNVTVRSEVLNENISMRISTRALRSIEHNGGLDSYLMTTANTKLTEEGVKLKRRVRRATASAAA